MLQWDSGTVFRIGVGLSLSSFRLLAVVSPSGPAPVLGAARAGGGGGASPGPLVPFLGFVACWGILTVIQGLVHNFRSLLVVRILLGVFESGFMPGATYFLSCWNRRDELGLRLAIFTSVVTLAGAFGGLLAVVIANMEGIGGKPAWRGSSCLRLSAAGERLQWRNIRKGFVDYKTWLCATCAIGSATPANSFAFFLPSIISMLGHSATRANLLTVPVHTVAWICVLTHEEQKRSDLTGIASTNLCRTEFAPWYTTGHAVTLAFTVVGVVSAIALHILLRRRKRVVNVESVMNVEAAKRDKGDERSGFRYII
ncbi:hypothetical protein ACEPAF_2855 [Sanghuangporus sanghuang]